MKITKLNVSKKFLSQESLVKLNTFVPDNITQLLVSDIEVVEKYGDSVEISLVVELSRVVGRRYLSMLTSKKEIVKLLVENDFKLIEEEIKLSLIEDVLKNNKSYLTQAIFNN